MNRYTHHIKSLLCSLVVGVLLLGSCTVEYTKRIEELQQRIDELDMLCDQLNMSIASIQRLVQVIESRDMITGITEIRNGNTVAGYKINFVKNDPVTIYNGLDGNVPLVASRQDPVDRNYYWTVQYGDGPVQWMLDSYGNKMPSIGKLPFISIRNGVWYYTADGKNWVELGQAIGQDGDTMIASIDTSNPVFVIVNLSNGQQLKIPTNEAYVKLVSDFNTLNENTQAQVAIIEAALDKLVCIESVSPLLSGTDTVGLTVKLSNGKSFTIHDWTASTVPVIFVKQHTDGKLYWAYQIGTQSERWVLDPSGKKIPASSEDVEAPLVSVEAGDDGNFYWAVTLGDSTTLLRYKVDDEWKPFAVDSVKGAFSSVNDYADSLVVVMKAGQRYVLPKMYTVYLTDSKGAPVGETLQMHEVSGGESVDVFYQTNGPSATLTLMIQGEFAVKAINGGFRITAPQKFESGSGKVVALFTFDGAPAQVTVVKTITIIK